MQREGRKGEEREWRMWEGRRWWQGEDAVGDRRGIYIVPYTLTFGHYDLAGIRLTALMEL